MDTIVQTLNTAGRAFVLFALPMLLQSSLLILLLLALDALLRRRVRAVFRYWIWMLVLVKLVLPPSLWSPVSIGTWVGDELEISTAALLEPEPPQPAEAPSASRSSPAAYILSSPDPAFAVSPGPLTEEMAPPPPLPAEDEPAMTEPAGPTLTWQGFVLLLWGMTVVALLLLLLQRAYFVQGLVAQAEPADHRMLGVLEECRAHVHLRCRVALRLSPNATSPAVCGLLRTTILIPQNLAPRLQGRDLRAVFLHELAHIRRGDLWVNLAQTLLQIAYFYHPLLWLANAVMRRAREQAVDETVLVAMGETAAQYPETLVNVAKLAFRRRPVLSLRLVGVVESKSALSARIKHMLSRPLPRTAKLGLLGLLMVVATATVLLPMAAAAERPLSENRTGPLAIRFVGVCPDESGEILDATGKKVEEMPYPLVSRPVWQPGRLRRDFVFEVPQVPEPVLFVRYRFDGPAGWWQQTDRSPLVPVQESGRRLLFVSEELPRVWRKPLLGILPRDIPLDKIDITLGYFYGPGRRTRLAFAGPFQQGQALPAAGGAEGRLTVLAPQPVMPQSEPRPRFRLQAPVVTDAHAMIVLYDTGGARHIAGWMEGRLPNDPSTTVEFSPADESLTLAQIARIAVEEPYELTVRNVRVDYPDRPARDHAAYLDIMAERLGLTGLSPEELGRYEFKTAQEAIAVLDVIRGFDHIQRAVQKIVLSQKPPGGVTVTNGRPVNTVVLDAAAREKIRQAATGWLKSPSVWLRAEAVKLGLTAGLQEFVDPAFALLEYRHPTIPRETRNVRYNVLIGLWRYRDNMTAADIERLNQFVLRCDDGQTWGHLFEYCFRTALRAEVSDALWELAQDERPWLWWPAIRALRERRDERLNASAALPEQMTLRVILATAWRQPAEEALPPKTRAILRDLFTVETIRLCPQSWSEMYRAVGNYLDRQEATAVYMDFLEAASQPQTRWRFEVDYGDPSPLYNVVSNLLRDINLWYSLDIGQLGTTEQGKINKSIHTARAFEQAVTEALNWYRATGGTPAGSSAVHSTRNQPSANQPQGISQSGPAAEDAGRDSDGDGLSDFQEVHKYLTDPKKKDSDDDGTPDGDWNERREYAYSVRTVLRYLPPFDEKGLNDDFQDARVLKQSAEYVEIEVIHYPLATGYDAIPENTNWRRDYAREARLAEYLAPGVTTNWDEQMKKDLLAALKADGIDVETLTDKQVVERVSSWLLKRSRSLDNVFTTYYVDYPQGTPRVYPGLEDAFRREFERDSRNYDWPIEKHFDHEVLGKGMFYNKTHGSCTSTAIYLTTVLRALGIPTRMVLATPVVDASNREQILMVKDAITHNRVRLTMLTGLSRSSHGFTNHTFNEVYVGNRWCRLDYNQLGCSNFGVERFGMQTHLYTFHDLSDVNFAPTWGQRYARGEHNDTFPHDNPYSAVAVSELFGPHGNIPNPPFTAQDLASHPEPDIFLYYPSSVRVWQEFIDLVAAGTANKTGRPHQKEFYENLFDGIWLTRPQDILVLLFSLDTPERVPAGYEGLLPKPWPDIESALQRGETVELGGKAREMNVILLAAPTGDALKALMQNSKLLNALRKTSGPAPTPVVSPTRSGAGGTVAGSVVKLDGGVTVELLGVCEYPSEGKPWWRPDGSTLDAAPYQTVNNKREPKEGFRDYELVVRYGGAPEMDYQWDVPGSASTSITGHPCDAAGEPVPDLTVCTVRFPQTQTATDVRVATAAGAWETRATHTGLEREGSYPLEGGKAVAFGIPYAKDDATFVPVTTDFFPRDMAFRVVAMQGQNEAHSGGMSGFGDKLNSLTYRFKCPLSEIRELRFQTRPWTWVEFRNVTLRPGLRTEAQAERLSAAQANRAPRRGPGAERVLGIGPAWEALRDALGGRYEGSIGGFSTEESRCAEYFQKVLSWTRPGDTFVLMFAFDTTAAVPASYQDLLPLPWSQIESRVRQGEQVEAQGTARDLNVVLLAAPTLPQLNTLIGQTHLLDAFRSSPSQQTQPSQEPVSGQRRVVLPEADQRPVVLDLATGELVPLPPVGPEPAKVQEALRKLGKGDLLYDQDLGDHTLILWRDATSPQAQEDTGEESIRGYLIGPQLPEVLTVTTAEGRRYEIQILAAADKACTLVYAPTPAGKNASRGALAGSGEDDSPTRKAMLAGDKLVRQPEDALKRLIDAAQPGETVTVPKGRYTTPVEITKPVVLRGESKEDCVIEVTADQPAVLVNTGGRGDVTVENLTIQWQLATDKRIERPTALLVKDTNARIRNCRFVPLGDYKRSPTAVYIDGRSNSTVDNCRFSGFEYTVCYGPNTQGAVQDCIIADCGHQGVINYDGAALTVQRCLITGSKFHAVRCTGGTLDVKDNLLINNANRGIYLGNKTGRGTITNNVILGNGTGISGFGRAQYSIDNNVIAGNSYAGIDMRDSCQLSILNNVLAKNLRGIMLHQEGTDNFNVIGKNTYWANATDVENVSKPEGSVTADPQFADPNHGDFTVRGSLRDERQGLIHPEVIKQLWAKYEQLQRERPVQPATRAEPVSSSALAPSQSAAALAWQRTDVYVPPDPNGFFLDDPEGGKKLDVLFQAMDKDSRSDEEVLSTVRQGLRRTTQHRTLILRWIGNRYIWGKDPQNAQAIEIMYHAVPLERYYAVYFGLSVAQDKTPNILHTLADICLQAEGQEVGRITWGLGSQREQLLAYITPHLQDSDPGRREIAQVLVKHFRGELDFEQWQRDRHLEQIKVQFAGQLPQFKETLRTGASDARYEVFTTILRHQMGALLDDSFLPAMQAASGDSDPRVRNEVARVAGGRWVWSEGKQDPNAIALMLKLSSDSDRQVRYNAVYYGLSVVRDKSEPVIRRLVELALTDHENNLYGRIVWGFRSVSEGAPDPFVSILAAQRDRARSDAHYAASVYSLYREVLGKEPPDDWGLAQVRQQYPDDLFIVPFSAREPFRPQDADALWNEFTRALPAEITADRLPIWWDSNAKNIGEARIRGQAQAETVRNAIANHPRLRAGEIRPLPLPMQLYLEEMHGVALRGASGTSRVSH